MGSCRQSIRGLKRLKNLMKLMALAVFFGSLFCCFEGFFTKDAAATCISISDDPMETKVGSAPPIIMFVLDNSGSMDWEFMTSENDGLFEGYYYLYPDSAYIDGNDRAYSDGHELPESEQKNWKSQWSGYNKVYYNPDASYSPWPEKSDADTSQPWSNPDNTGSSDSKLDLTGEYYTVESAGAVEVIIDNSDTGYFMNNSSA